MGPVANVAACADGRPPSRSVEEDWTPEAAKSLSKMVDESMMEVGLSHGRKMELFGGYLMAQRLGGLKRSQWIDLVHAKV